MQVLTLDDIVNLDERSVDNHFIEGNKLLISRSIYKWPNQLLPPRKLGNVGQGLSARYLISAKTTFLSSRINYIIRKLPIHSGREKKDDIISKKKKK